MADYIEMHIAQVRTRARAFTHMYNKVQHLIKSRTKAGYINGNYMEVLTPNGEFNWNRRITHDSDTLKLTVSVVTRSKPYERLFFYFF